MPIQWREEMAIDHDLIDQDHQALIGIINRFSCSEASVAALPGLQAILNKLERYASAHFTREETLQRLAQYTYADAHRHEHLDLIRELGQMREELARLAASPEKAAANVGAFHAHMADLLHHWLIDHVIKSDLRMKPYAAKMAPHARRMMPLAQSVI